MNRKINATLRGAAALLVMSCASLTQAGDTPVLSGTYGWEDEVGTILGSSGTISEAANVSAEAGVIPNSGDRMLRVTESPHSAGAQQAYIAYIEHLQDGDIVTASFFGFDETPGTNPSLRIWAHYALSGDVESQVGSAGGNNTFTSGEGWDQVSHTWVFDSAGGTRDALVIEARVYSANCPKGEECSTDYYIDDVAVDVFCAADPDLTITFADGTVIGNPSEPDPDCGAPLPGACDISDLGTPDLEGSFGWEDGKSTILGFFGNDNVLSANVAPTDGINPNSGDRMLMLTEEPHAGTPQAYVAFIEGLEHGDTVFASFRGWDDTPGASPSVRIWAHYAQAGDPESFSGSASGNEDFSAGTGWDPVCHTWVFDAGTQSPPRDALMIEVRLYSSPATCEECSTDYFIDDVEVAVFSDNPNVTITFADGKVIGDPGEPVECTADVDGSGDIDLFDVFAVNGAWGTADPDADVNEDGDVDGADLGIVLASIGPCSQFLLPLPGEGALTLEDSRAGILRQYDLYVELDAAEAIVNIYDAAITSSLGFESGSFITIGADEPHFDVVEDSNFNSTEFSSGTSLGTNAGWYNFDPSNNLGLAGQYPDNRVLIARFFVDPETEFDANLAVTYEDEDGRSRQVTLNLEPDVTPCPGDLTGSGSVGVPDLLALLSCWGPVGPGCENADLTSNGTVGVPDLLELLSNWGACP